jgi:pimeloyl-ACP methyl ester carboxylesterase
VAVSAKKGQAGTRPKSAAVYSDPQHISKDLGMTRQINRHSALTAPTLFVDLSGRQLAYRTLGEGRPIVLCNRFRGILDSWDPAFLDTLAESFTVIYFDYSGLGVSTGNASFNPRALANDARDLAWTLGYEEIVIAGWSLGGQAAQAFTALYPEMVSHTILIGSIPPGQEVKGSEQIFFDTALKFDNDLKDETILFFEPNSEASRDAAQASHDRIAMRTTDRDTPIPEHLYMRLLREEQGVHPFMDKGGYWEKLSATMVPILAICGDHDSMSPVENWHALNARWNTLEVITFPQAGHGPHHQYPKTVALYIATFVNTIA